MEEKSLLPDQCLHNKLLPVNTYFLEMKPIHLPGFQGKMLVFISWASAGEAPLHYSCGLIVEVFSYGYQEKGRGFAEMGDVKRE